MYIYIYVYNHHPFKEGGRSKMQACNKTLFWGGGPIKMYACNFWNASLLAISLKGW